MESYRIDMDGMRAAKKAECANRLLARAASINNRNIQNPLHFLRLPREIRLAIYDILFKGARLTFNRVARTPVVRLGDWFFDRENIPNDILFVCKDIQEEALSSLFANLIVDESTGSTDFDKMVSLRTRTRAQQIWNMQPHFAFSVFSSMRLWVLSEKFIINGGLWTEFTTLDSKEMFTNAINQIDGEKMPGKDFLNLVRLAPRPQHTAFIGKINLLCCYKVGRVTNQVLFPVSSETNVCVDHHESLVSYSPPKGVPKLIFDFRAMCTSISGRRKQSSTRETSRVMMLASWPSDECEWGVERW